MKNNKENHLHGSYLYKFFLHFMLTLCIPLMTIFLLYLQAEKVVKEQIIMSSQNTLNQFFNLIDATAEEMREVAISLANNKAVQNYSSYAVYRPEKATYKLYEVKQILNSLLQQKFYDIIVYFPEEDRIISAANASLKADYYYDAYLQEPEYDFREEFRSVVGCDSKRPVFQVMNQNNLDSYLCVSMKQFVGRDSRLNYVVTLILKPEYISRMMLGRASGCAETIIMFSGDKEMLLSSDTEDIPYTLKGYVGNDDFYEDEFAGDTYVIQVQEAQALDGYYASAIPHRYFWRKLWELRLLCGIGGILCAVVSVLLARWNAGRAYRPIDKMVGILQKQSGIAYSKGAGSEFEFVESLFRKENEEKTLLHRKIKSGENMRLEKFVVSLLEGNVAGDTAWNDIFYKNGMIIYSDRFFVGVLYIETDETEGGKDFLSFIIHNVFMELSVREHQGYMADLSGNHYAVLVNQKVLVNEEAMGRIFREGRQFLKKYYGVDISVGMSRVHEGMTEIKTAYEEAVQALHYRYLTGVGSIISYEEIMDRGFRYLPSAESGLSVRVTSFIREADSDETAEQFVLKIMELYEINTEASLETVECFKFDMVNTINMAAMSGGCSSGERQGMIRDFLSQPSLDTMKAYLIHLLSSFRQKEKERMQQKSQWKEAKRYIENNFTDPSLSVSMLGEQLDISPSYLSKIFKDEYGISILDYITRIRIQNAKAQLRNTKKSVSEIAEENGFLSSNVFIKAFKKLEGITPGVYRKLI